MLPYYVVLDITISLNYHFDEKTALRYYVLVMKFTIRETWLSAIPWQIYFQSNLNLFSAGSPEETLIQGIMVMCY